MTIPEIFELAMRWIHGMATLLWLGGSLLYVLVLGPIQRQLDPILGPHFNQHLSQEFRSWINLSVGALIVSGTILTLMRISSDLVSLPYIIVLAFKISLAIVIFFLLRPKRTRRPSIPSRSQQASMTINIDETLSSPWTRLRSLFTGVNLAVILGVVVYLLADVLRLLFEQSIRLGS